LQRDVKRLGLSAAFQFRPYQDPSLLAQSLSLPDVHWISLIPAMEGLIVPSKFYGIAAAGRPTIAVTDPAGEIATLVSRFDCGVTVSPGDSEKLAKVLRDLRANPGHVATMGRNARHMLEQSFSRHQSFARWDSIIEDIQCVKAARPPYFPL
jgi:colanic acid biosynthesis glycosyl transferase WcaI